MPEQVLETPDDDPRNIRTVSDWVSALAILRGRTTLTVRDLASRTESSRATIGDYLSGRHLPGPASQTTFRKMLEALGVTAADDQQAWFDALTRVRRAGGGRPADTPAPYRGLDGYRPEDRELFFGRESLVDELVERVTSAGARVVVVVGSSGAGKSSVVHAGLVPRLAELGWAWHSITPGTVGNGSIDPRPGVAPSAEGPAAAIPSGDAPTGPAPRTLLIVDQLEELWTHGFDDAARASFLARLEQLAGEPTVVLLTALRADFYPRALQSAFLAGQLQRNQVVVGPMTSAELTRAIVEPAHASKVSVEDALVPLILQEFTPLSSDNADETSAALPLLSFALLQAWSRSDHRTITVRDYLNAGGISGAIAATAEAAYGQLDAAQAELARRLFMRLVLVRQDTGDVRRRATRAELVGLDRSDGVLPESPPSPRAALDSAGQETPTGAVIEHFVRARLLSAAEGSITISHEALLTAWPRLRGWLDADRAVLLQRQQLGERAAEWRAAANDPDLLLRGGPLDLALRWSGDTDHAASLTADERAYLAASTAERDRVRELERRRTRRLKLLAAGLAVALVAVAGTTLYTVRLGAQARRDRDAALSRQLAEVSDRLRATDTTVAAEFALLAYRTSPTVESRSALLDSTALPQARRFQGPGGLPAAALNRAGTVLVAAGDQGGVAWWALDGNQKPLAVLTRQPQVDKQPFYAVAITPDGRLTAAGGAAGTIHLWDSRKARQPQELAPLSVGNTSVFAMTISPDGETLAATTTAGQTGEGKLWLWHIDGIQLTPITTIPQANDGGLQAVAFSPDGSVIAAGGTSGVVHRWSRKGSTLTRLGDLTGPTGTVTALTFTPRGTTLSAASKDQNIYSWTLPEPAGSPTPPEGATEGGTATVISGARSWVNTLAYDATGTTLVAGSSDSHVRVYDVATQALLQDLGHPGAITTTLFTPQGDMLITGGADGRLRQWSMPPAQGAVPDGRVFTTTFVAKHQVVAVSSLSRSKVFDTSSGTPRAIATFAAPAGGDEFDGNGSVDAAHRLLAIGGHHGTAWVYRYADDGNPQLIATLPPQRDSLINTATILDGGRIALVTDDASTMQVWDISDPAHPAMVGKPITTRGPIYSMTVSPDGSTIVTGTGTSGAVELWDVSNPRSPRSIAQAPSAGGPTLQVYGVAWSPDGRTVAVGSADQSQRFLDVSDREHPAWTGAVLRDAHDYLYAASYSGDGAWFANASGDGTVHLYDTKGRTVRLWATLTASDGAPLYSVSVAPGGDQVSSGGAASAQFLWTLDPDAAADRICSLIGEPIEAAEWQRYLPSVPLSDPCGSGRST